MYTWFIWIFFSCLGHLHILQYATECQLFWPKWLTWFIEELQLPLMKTNRLSLFLVCFDNYFLFFLSFCCIIFPSLTFLLTDFYFGSKDGTVVRELASHQMNVAPVHIHCCPYINYLAKYISVCRLYLNNTVWNILSHGVIFLSNSLSWLLGVSQRSCPNSGLNQRKCSGPEVLCTAHYKDLILETGNHKWKFSGTRLSTFVTE